MPGPETDILAKAAKDAGLYLTIGVIERDGGTLHCTALFFGPEGTLLGKHRKLMPTALERLCWGFGDGSTLTTVPTPWGPLGSVICWENYMPMLRMAMYNKGIAIYCAPTADDRDSWTSTMQHLSLIHIYANDLHMLMDRNPQVAEAVEKAVHERGKTGPFAAQEPDSLSLIHI